MYGISRFVDENGKAWAVKTLKDTVVERFYPHMGLEEVFDEHLDEHLLFIKHLGDMVVPAEYYEEVDELGGKYFAVVQPWVEGGVQYREAIKHDRQVSGEQLGPLEQRVKFVKGLTELMKETGKLPDLDFFLMRESGEVKIKVFDTSYMYYDKREGRDRWIMAHDLSKFIFTSEERETNEEVKLLINALEG